MMPLYIHIELSTGNVMSHDRVTSHSTPMSNRNLMLVLSRTGSTLFWTLHSRSWPKLGKAYQIRGDRTKGCTRGVPVTGYQNIVVPGCAADPHICCFECLIADRGKPGDLICPSDVELISEESSAEVNSTLRVFSSTFHHTGFSQSCLNQRQ